MLYEFLGLAQTNTTDSCNDFRLEFGQNYFSIQAYPAKRINSTLRGSGGIYKGELKQNVDIVISGRLKTMGILLSHILIKAYLCHKEMYQVFTT